MKKDIKINFFLDDQLPLNQTKEITVILIVVRASFYENNKYYPQMFLDESLHKI